MHSLRITTTPAPSTRDKFDVEVNLGSKQVCFNALALEQIASLLRLIGMWEDKQLNSP